MSKETSSAKVSSLNLLARKSSNSKTFNLTAKNLSKILLKCPDCGIEMSLREGKYGLSYFCKDFPICRGSHKASKKGKPLGFPADKETRLWRIKAHEFLGALYKGDKAVMTKTEAYGFLAYSMRLKVKQAHISRLNLSQCKVLIALLDFGQ